jgi:hypothetical protein
MSASLFQEIARTTTTETISWNISNPIVTAVNPNYCCPWPFPAIATSALNNVFEFVQRQREVESALRCFSLILDKNLVR